MSRWIRRNGRWLAALAIVLPTTAAVSFSDSWREYRDYEWRIPHHAGLDQSVAYAGADWRLLDLTDETDGLLEEPLPEGTAFIVASIRVDGPEDVVSELYCTVRLTDGERRWSQVGYGEVSWQADDDFGISCTEGSVQVGFLVPAGAVPELREQGRLEISLVEQLPEYISFEP